MIGVLINLFQKWKLYSILKYVRREGVKKWKKKTFAICFSAELIFSSDGCTMKITNKMIIKWYSRSHSDLGEQIEITLTSKWNCDFHSRRIRLSGWSQLRNVWEICTVPVEICYHMGPEDNFCSTKISKDSVLAKLSDLMLWFRICKFKNAAL